MPSPCPAPGPCADEVDVVGVVGVARQIAARHDRIRVAQRRGGELTNSYRERAWDGCTLPELPYFVYLARDGAYYRLAFDLDAARGDVQRDAATLRRLLTEAGIRFIEARSGPAGGHHLIAVFHAPLPGARVAALARHLAEVHLPTLDPTCLCNPATGGVRPPGSPHRHGGGSVLLTPAAVAASALAEGNGRDAFDRLCTLAGMTVWEAHGTPDRPGRPPRPLSPRLQRLEREGDVDGAYHDRSAVAAAIALGYINAGLPFERFLVAALDPACRGLDHLRRVRTGVDRYRLRGDAEARAAAGRMWHRRERFAEQHPPSGRPAPAPGIDKLVAAVRAAADGTPYRWGGQAGRSDRAVLDAFLDDVRRWPEPEVPASHRRLAERSGIGRSTVGRALRRLADDGWLELCAVAAGMLAATYRPAIPPSAVEHAPTETAEVAPTNVRSWVTSPAPCNTDSLTVTITAQSHDVFTCEGLGRYAAAVFVALTEGPDTAVRIAARTGLSARTVRRHLRRLAEVGLVGATGTLWSARDLDALDGASQLLGVTGTVARRTETHAAERHAYRWYAADFTARRGWTAERGLWRTGRHTLGGRDRRPAPSVAFPRRDGRADPTRALHLVLEGHGPAPESVMPTTPAVAATRIAGDQRRAGAPRYEELLLDAA